MQSKIFLNNSGQLRFTFPVKFIFNEKGAKNVGLFKLKPRLKYVRKIISNDLLFRKQKTSGQRNNSEKQIAALL